MPFVSRAVFQMLPSIYNHFTVPLGAAKTRTRIHTHTHTCSDRHPLDPWDGALSQERALRQGVTTGTAAGAESQSLPPPPPPPTLPAAN